MYSKSSLINWLFFDSIFGVLIIGGLVYVIRRMKNLSFGAIRYAIGALQKSFIF